MAAYTVAAGKFGSYGNALAASTVDTVTFSDRVRTVEVSSDGSAAVYFTVDGTTPTVAAAGSWVLPAGAPSVRTVAVPVEGGTIVSLISAGTPVYHVTAVK